MYNLEDFTQTLIKYHVKHEAVDCVLQSINKSDICAYNMLYSEVQYRV